MARLPQVTQKVECTVPGYEDSGIFIRVWVNAPQRIFDEWTKKKQEAIIVDDEGRPEFETDESGEVMMDDDFKPIQKIDASKLQKSSAFFLSSLITEFSLTEDLDGNPLSLTDEDFLKRVPEDLIRWLFDAVSEAIGERRKVGKESVRLAEITGQQYGQA